MARAALGRLAALANVGAALRWWGQGLMLWLPASLRQRLTPTPTRLVLEPHEDALIVCEEKGPLRRELNRFGADALVDGSLQLPRLAGRQLVLRLDPAQTLTKTTALPLAAENNLRQVIGFEIDRLTPFTADKLYYDARVVERRPAERTVQVRFAAVLRGALDTLLKQLQRYGHRPDVVDVALDDARGRINLLPPALRPKRGAARWLRWLLTLLVLLTLAVLAVLPLWQQRAVAIDLMPRVSDAQRQAEFASKLRARVDSAVESSQFLFQKRNAAVPVLDLLNELTELLPDNTWVEQLIIKDGEVQVRGQSRNATALIGLVEASPYFVQATFRSPVTPDRRTGADRFFLTARIAADASSVAREARLTVADPS